MSEHPRPSLPSPCTPSPAGSVRQTPAIVLAWLLSVPGVTDVAEWHMRGRPFVASCRLGPVERGLLVEAIRAATGVEVRFLGTLSEQTEARQAAPQRPAVSDRVRELRDAWRRAWADWCDRRDEGTKLAADRAWEAYQDALVKPEPDAAFPRLCSCGHNITWSHWRSLRLVGLQDDGQGGKLEIRDCPICESSLAMPAEMCGG